MYVVCACYLLARGDLFQSIYFFKIYIIAMDIYIERERETGSSVLPLVVLLIQPYSTPKVVYTCG